MTERRCGPCQLCCKLLPVAEFDKPAGKRCRHQRMAKGCAIYARRPMTCRLWDCRWLNGDDTADLRRPDLSHYVIDMLPDFVTMVADPSPFDKGSGGSGQVDRRQIPVVQVWVDPRFRDAHLDPALRDYMQRRGHDGFGTIVRFSSSEAIVIFPPSLTGAGWIVNDSSVAGPEHRQETIAAVLTAETGEDWVAAHAASFRKNFG